MSGEPTPQPPVLETEWRRLHPLSPLLRGGLVLIVVAGIVIANLRDRFIELFLARGVVDAMGPNEGDIIDYLAGRSLLVWALLGVAVVVLLIIGIAWFSWRFSTYRITSEAVEVKHGVLFRQHRRAPLERIQSVNLQRSLLARILGLTQVDVQTAGQGGKVALQFLGHNDAKIVREQILLAARVSKAGAAGVAVAPDAAAYGTPTVPGMPGAPIADAPVAIDPATGLPYPAAPVAQTPQGPIAVDFAGQPYTVAAGAIDSRLRDIADFDIDPSARASGMMIKVPVGRLIGSILLSSEMIVMLGVVAAIIIGSIFASPFMLAAIFPFGIVMVGVLIAQFNKGFNFVLSRAEDGVRIGAGLTATSTETIPFGRVHAVEALQPLGWRPFGWWKVRITTAGHSAADAGQNKMQNTVLPVGQLEDVVRVFETLLHEGGPGYEDRHATLRDALVGAGDGYIKAGRRGAWLLWFGVRRAGVQIDQPYDPSASLRVRRGWLTRSLSVMPIVRAQSVQLTRSLGHYLLGLASVKAHTVLGPVRMQMRGLELNEAQRFFDALAANVVYVQGLDATSRVAVQSAPAHAAPAHAAPVYDAPNAPATQYAQQPVQPVQPQQPPVQYLPPVQQPIDPQAPTAQPDPLNPEQ
ncbi:PH domain-containing protein [Leucobacter sp. UT-8R-CII-1-4]|uniref:PH domain-containing protein n=1 Tax=Leucobacter sp. UT-8R-CII-1-4 TaxID=3040075 RepID=UPI0024A9C1A6|nr:PH domain-containing protein [Leucobacter sp. UT-8R-CII-1-4]MDI6022463.1 PH domain-containing protein [Leucobacter sp. UT-8R-CII-1-4]